MLVIGKDIFSDGPTGCFSNCFPASKAIDNWCATPRWFDPIKADSVAYYVTNQNSLEWPEC